MTKAMLRNNNFIFTNLLAALLFIFFVGNLKAAEIKEILTPGGIKAWFVQENAIPILNMEVVWKGGASILPKEKAGLAELMASTMDEGAGEMDSKAFQKALADNSISLSFDAGKDTYRGRFKTLSANKEMAFSLFQQAIQDPRFDQEAVDRIRNQLLVSLNRKKTDPNSLAGRAWFDIAFKGHPYAVPTMGNIETMQQLTTQDLHDLKNKQISRNNMVISVIGDISEADLIMYLDKTFADLPEKPDVQDVAEFGSVDGPKTQFIEQNIPQSIIVFGGKGVKRDDPDYYAAYVLNYILGGGGFESRLQNEVREKRGLVYSIYSYLSPFEAAGVHLGGFSTGAENTIKAVELVREELRKIIQDGVTSAELEAAKKYLNGSFGLRLSSNAKIARVMASMQFSKLPITYLDDRKDLIGNVSLEDIKRVAQKLMDPDQMIITVVGQPALKESWESYFKKLR